MPVEFELLIYSRDFTISLQLHLNVLFKNKLINLNMHVDLSISFLFSGLRSFAPEIPSLILGACPSDFDRILTLVTMFSIILYVLVLNICVLKTLLDF